MFSRRKRNQRKKWKITKKEIISISILLLTILLFLVLSNYVFGIYRIRHEFAKQMKVASEKETIFSLDKIILFNSADAKRNETPRAIWDLDLYQYTDIAIYLNNYSENDITEKNTIDKLWIDEFHIGSPYRGISKLSYKAIKDFGKFTFSEESSVPDTLSYLVTESSSSMPDSSLTLYTDNTLPITLEYANLVQQNFVIPILGNNSLNFDGTLLKKASIPLSSLQTRLAFTIHIVNKLGEEYSCNITVPILENISYSEEENLYQSGSLKQTLSSLSHYTFYKK